MFSEQEEIRLFFRLSMIEKYIKSLSKFKIKVLFDEKKFENPFEIKFPNICCGEGYETRDEILDKIEILEKMKKIKNIPLYDKYLSVIEIMNEIISVKYFKRYMDNFELFYDEDLIKVNADTDTDTDTNTDTDTDSYKGIDSDSVIDIIGNVDSCNAFDSYNALDS